MAFKFIFSLTVLLLLPAKLILAQEFTQLSGVIHVHTTFSSGKYSIEQLVSKAKEKKLDVIVLSDHDLVVMEYGLSPLRSIIKRREERKSVIQQGPQYYLEEIERQNNLQDDVIVIPGVQSSPFYYWSGSPFKKNLAAHNYRKELLLIGMQNPSDYRQLPLLHNGFSQRYFSRLLPRSVIFLISFLLGLYLFFQKKLWKILGVLVAIASLFLLIDHHPFKSSLFDPYHGDQGIAPYQEVIDFVAQRQGLTFWAHPESNYAVDGVQLGPVKLITGHYANDLLGAKNYTGFAAVYGDTSTANKPGEQWDRILTAYCRGLRQSAVWAIAGADFHTEKMGVQLDTFQTVFMVKKKSATDVLDALAKGRVYAVRKSNEPRMVLEKFEVADPMTPRKVVMGQGLNIKTDPVLKGRVTASDDGRMTVHVDLIRGGKIWQSFGGLTPLEFHFVDRDPWRGKTFYRVEIRDSTHGKLISNPIFVAKERKGRP